MITLTSAAVAVLVYSGLRSPDQSPELPLGDPPLLPLHPPVRVSPVTWMVTLVILMTSTPSSSGSSVITKLPVQLLLHL